MGGGSRRIGVSLMTNPCASRSVAVQDVDVKATNYERSKAQTLDRDKLLSFAEFPVSSALARLRTG